MPIWHASHLFVDINRCGISSSHMKPIQFPIENQKGKRSRLKRNSIICSITIHRFTLTLYVDSDPTRKLDSKLLQIGKSREMPIADCDRTHHCHSKRVKCKYFLDWNWLEQWITNASVFFAFATIGWALSSTQFASLVESANVCH